MESPRDALIIDKVLEEEGGLTNNPRDKGGPTAFGISKVSNPEAWKNGPPTQEEARALYEQKYIKGPGFDSIVDTRLMSQVVDYAVLSGPQLVVMTLQGILGLKRDGILGPDTKLKVNQADPRHLNNLLLVERVKMIGRIVSKNPSQAEFLNGWLSRVLSFLIN